MLSSALAAILSTRPIVDALTQRLRQSDPQAMDTANVQHGLQRLLAAAAKVDKETKQLLAQGAGLTHDLSNGH